MPPIGDSGRTLSVLATVCVAILLSAPSAVAQDEGEAFRQPEGFEPTRPPAEGWFEVDARPLATFQGLPAAFAAKIAGRTPEEQSQEADRYLRRNGRDLNLGRLDQGTKETIAIWARWRASQLASAETRVKTGEVASDIYREMSQLASVAGNVNAKRQFRDFANGELLAQLRTLLDAGYTARLNAVTLMGFMRSLGPGALGLNTPPVAYAPAVPAALDVLDDAEQPEPVRTAAAAALVTLLRDEETLPVADKFRAAEVLSRLLGDKELFWWTQRELLRAIVRLDVTLDERRRPVIYDAVGKVVADEKRHLLVRSEAIRTLARIPLPPQVSATDVAAEIARRVNALAAEYNAAPRRREFVAAFWNVYMAFATLDARDKQRLAQNSMLGVFRERNTPAIRAIYDKILPVLKHVLQNVKSPRPLPPATLSPLEEEVAGLAAAS